MMVLYNAQSLSRIRAAALCIYEIMIIFIHSNVLVEIFLNK